MTRDPRKTLSKIAVALWFAVAGCNRGTAPPQEIVKIRILAAVVPLADLVRQVGGPYVEVESVCEAGQDPRDVTVTDPLRRRIAKADLLVGSGYGEVWTAGGMGGMAESERVIRPELTAAGKARPVATADLWLDPEVAKQLVEMTRERLATRDPPHGAEYRKNATEALQRLEALDTRLREGLAPLKGARFVELRPSWAAFAERYGLEDVSPVDTRPEQLSDDDARRVRAAAKKAGATVIVVDSSVSSGVVHQLESQTGLAVLPLDRLGSSAPDARSTYARVMEYNLQQLVKGLKK